MAEDSTFPTLEVASALSGISLCDTSVSRMQEIWAKILGRQVWTHELAHGPTKESVRAAGAELFPDMPTRSDAQFNWQAAAEKAVAAYGESVVIPHREGQRTAGPVETFAEILNTKETPHG